MKVELKVHHIILFLVFVILIWPVTGMGQTWTWVGSIDGEAYGDKLGTSVSLSADGSTVAIGAPYHMTIYDYFNDIVSEGAGRVRIYQYAQDANSWTQIGSDIDGEAAGDRSGMSVSLSRDGSIVAIGASGNDGNGDNAGHVRIYQYARATNSWTQIGSDIDGEAAGDISGASVSLSANGSIVAIGASTNGNVGNVRIYQYAQDTNSWIQIGSDIPGETNFDGSGMSVSLSANGSIVAIGASKNGGAGDVRIYQYAQATNSWTQIGSDIHGEAVGDESGRAVSISDDGSTVAIGAPYNDGNGDKAGHVRIYRYAQATNSWIQIGSDIDGEAAGDHSGSSVSLSRDGSVVAIGATLGGNFYVIDEWGSLASTGYVRIYQYAQDTDSWIQVGSDFYGGQSVCNRGLQVSLSDYGSVVAIGDPGSGGYCIDWNSYFGDMYPEGRVRVYARNATNIKVTPTNISFSPSSKEIAEKATLLDSVIIMNKGKSALNFTFSIPFNGDSHMFSVTSKDCTGSLRVNQRCELDVSFFAKEKPTHKYISTLVITSNDPFKPKVTVQLEGNARRPIPGSLYLLLGN